MNLFGLAHKSLDEYSPDYSPEYTFEYGPEYTSEYIPEYSSEYIPEYTSEYSPEYTSEFPLPPGNGTENDTRLINMEYCEVLCSCRSVHC